MAVDIFLTPIRGIRGESAEIPGDTFDFNTELTSEPTVSEGRVINDCESKTYLQTRLLGDGAAPQLTSEPTAPAPTGHEIREHVEFTYQKIVWDIDGSTDDLAVDPTNPNVPPHTPEWTDFNSGDPGLLLPYTDFDIA